MRSLRVVGITEDGAVVLEDSARRERYTVPADEQLRAAARGDLTRLGQIAIELESQLRPREIQARIRAGASVDQVASAAGVPVAKIERFAYPVLLERARTAELARSAHPVREDGPDLRTLEETVAHTFGVRGQDAAAADWDSWKGEDGRWVVALGWRSGKSDIRAHWTFQPGAHGGTVTALDDHARDLVEGRPQQPLRPVGPVIDMARTEEEAPAPAGPESVPAAVNGSAPITPEQRRGPAAGRGRGRAETRTEVRSETRVDDRSETRPDAGVEVPHPAERRTDTRRGSAPAGPVETSTASEVDGAGRRVESPGAENQGEADGTEPRSETRGAELRAGESRLDGRAVETRDAAPAARAAESAPDESPTDEPAAKTPAKPRAKKGKPVMPSWDEVLLGVRGR